MRKERVVSPRIAALVVTSFFVAPSPLADLIVSHASATQSAAPHVTLTPSLPIVLPGEVDSNSPAIWDLVDGQQTLFVMTSFAGRPQIASGRSLTTLSAPAASEFSSPPPYGTWMEAVVADDGGAWYGYYHREEPAIVCGRPDRFVPMIGAARSLDHGSTWDDLGIILSADPSTVACDSTNRYVIGGVGDLSVMLDPSKTELYIFFSQYQKNQEAQGVAVGRLLWAARDHPVGRVTVWNDGAWLHGRLLRTPITSPDGTAQRVWIDYPEGTPLVPTVHAWHDADTEVDAFWGPSVHWNEYLQQYVMLLNRAKDEDYTEEGIYVSFAPRLDDPSLWSMPEKILGGGRWYPQVLGLVTDGTDKLSGATARLFMSGRSEWTISFAR
jgi:hypothetical protein